MSEPAWLTDSSEHRESILASNLAKINQTRWEPFYNKMAVNESFKKNITWKT